MSTRTEYALWKWLADTAKKRVDVLKPQVVAELTAAEAERVKVVIDGQQIATLSVGNRKPSVSVSDEEALIAWAADNDPSLIETVTRLKPYPLRDFLAAMLDSRGYDHQTGEQIPGLRYDEGGPASWPVCKITDETALIAAIRTMPDLLALDGGAL